MTATVIPLVLRRMRPPLLVLISAYAIAVLGFALIPGVDEQGNPWHMGFFHAFYFVSFTGSTIGLGEIPYDFTDGQRLWAVVCVYLTVTAWLYAIGTLIGLIRDPALQTALERIRVRRSVYKLREPFHLICGYGDTGRLLVRSLTARRRRVVVLDENEDRINELNLLDLPVHVPALRMDSGVPENLLTAGLKSRWCMSLLAITDNDHVNLRTAIIGKLLNPGLTVMCRAETAEAAANMASCGTDQVINPFESFADRLQMAIVDPDMHRIYDWLSGVPNTRLPERPEPPSGTWLLCGYGRFGRAVRRTLNAAGVRVVIVQEDVDAAEPSDTFVRGRGTEASTLTEAGIESADALLAGTPDDAENLSIIMTARTMRPDIFIAARVNSMANKVLYQAAEPDLAVEPNYITTSHILSVLNTPLLGEFLEDARKNEPSWHAELAKRIRAVTGGLVPESWTIRISHNRTPALARTLELGEAVPLGCVLRDPRNRDRQLSCLPLLLARGDDRMLLPDPEMVLESGDRILFCGALPAQKGMRELLNNLNSLRYVHTGEVRPDGLLWRRLARRRERLAPAKADREQAP